MDTLGIALALLAGRVSLAAMFAVAGLAKLANPPGAAAGLTGFGVPPNVATPLAPTLASFETLVAVGLIAPAPWGWWGAIGATVLLAVFTIAILANLVRGRQPACHCFGQLSAEPIGWATVARNAVLAVCATGLIWTGPGASTARSLSIVAARLHVRALWLVLAVGVAAAFAAETIVLWQLFRQHGRVLVRVDGLEQRLGHLPAQAPQGLAAGTVAPSFSLATLAGPLRSLEDLRQNGMPTVLIFVDPDCQPCAALLPEVSGWQRQHAGHLRIGVISRGTADRHQGRTERLDLSAVLLQNASEVSDAYRVPGTPAGVFIAVDGTIGHALALGRDAIADLIDMAAKRRVDHTADTTVLPTLDGAKAQWNG